MQVFISYNYVHNQGFVDDLCKALKAMDITPSIINLQLMYGDEIIHKVDDAIKNCDHVLVVLSQGYINSDYLQKELFAFLKKETEMKSQIILPVLIEDCAIPAMLKDRVCDFREKTFKEGFKQLAKLISQTRQVFVVMHFGDKVLDSAYEGAIKPVINEFSYTPLRIDELQDSGLITSQILKEIARSEIIIADLTGERPNCYYEAGYAHALERKLILTAQKGATIHFDLAGYRLIVWETESDLREQLRKRFRAFQKSRRSSSFSKYKSLHF